MIPHTAADQLLSQTETSIQMCPMFAVDRINLFKSITKFDYKHICYFAAITNEMRAY